MIKKFEKFEQSEKKSVIEVIGDIKENFIELLDDGYELRHRIANSHVSTILEDDSIEDWTGLESDDLIARLESEYTISNRKYLLDKETYFLLSYISFPINIVDPLGSTLRIDTAISRIDEYLKSLNEYKNHIKIIEEKTSRLKDYFHLNIESIVTFIEDSEYDGKQTMYVYIKTFLK